MHHRRHRHHRHHRCPPSRARLPRRIARLHSAMQTPHTHLTRGLTSTIPHTPAVHLVQGFHAGERRPSPS
jgi:hypothetical protein